MIGFFVGMWGLVKVDVFVGVVDGVVVFCVRLRFVLVKVRRIIELCIMFCFLRVKWCCVILGIFLLCFSFCFYI